MKRRNGRALRTLRKRTAVKAIILLVCLSLLPIAAFADILNLDQGSIVIQSGASYTQGGVGGVNASGDYTIEQTSASTGNTITVAANAGVIAVTLNGVDIAASKPAMEVKSGADVNLTLEDDNSLAGGKYYAGLQVDGGASVTIDGDGSLAATGGQGGAGIGGGWGINTGDVVIDGGDVTARGGENAAGIGSGYKATSSGSVEVNDGTVNATGGKQGAGIGGGNQASGTTEVNIGGGDTTAQGGQYAAGIGGGNKGAADVTVTDGKVVATGAMGGAGIGGGYDGNAGDIAISGGDVTANGSQDASGRGGAGIGGGWGHDGGNIDLTGGDITAQGGKNAAGVGGGQWGGAGDIVIDGADVSAKGGAAGAGVGGGYKGTTGGSVEIKSGDVTATGGMGAAGIGSGDVATANPGIAPDVTISGGDVTAIGGGYAAGIGGGYRTDGGDTVISGGNVTATGGKTGAGIGGGGSISGTNGGDGGSVVISGGDVTAIGGQGAAGIGDGKASLDTGTLEISGGHVDASGSDGVKANVEISGGTSILTGADDGHSVQGSTAITGGSVTFSGDPSSAPTNGNENVYGVKVSTGLSEGTSVEGDVRISNAPGYGSKDMTVDQDGAVEVWTTEGQDVTMTVGGTTIMTDVPVPPASRGEKTVYLKNKVVLRATRTPGSFRINNTNYAGTVYRTDTMQSMEFGLGFYVNPGEETANLVVYTDLYSHGKMPCALALSYAFLQECETLKIKAIRFAFADQWIQMDVETLLAASQFGESGFDAKKTVVHFGLTAELAPFVTLKQGRDQLDVTAQAMATALVKEG